MNLGMRIYFDINTGDVIQVRGERQGGVVDTTIEQDVETYKSLSERNRPSFDYLELDYGQYTQDFRTCESFRVNPTTKQLEFSYPDPNTTEPVYQPPLSEQVNNLEQQNASLMSENATKTTQINNLEAQVATLMTEIANMKGGA